MFQSIIENSKFIYIQMVILLKQLRNIRLGFKYREWVYSSDIKIGDILNNSSDESIVADSVEFI